MHHWTSGVGRHPLKVKRRDRYPYGVPINERLVMLRLSDVYIKLGFCSSRKEFKRQVLTGSVKFNDMVVEEDMFFLPTGTLTLAIKLDDKHYAIPPEFHNNPIREWMIVVYDESITGAMPAP